MDRSSAFSTWNTLVRDRVGEPSSPRGAAQAPADPGRPSDERILSGGRRPLRSPTSRRSLCGPRPATGLARRRGSCCPSQRGLYRKFEQSPGLLLGGRSEREGLVALVKTGGGILVELHRLELVGSTKPTGVSVGQKARVRASKTRTSASSSTGNATVCEHAGVSNASRRAPASPWTWALVSWKTGNSSTSTPQSQGYESGSRDPRATAPHGRSSGAGPSDDLRASNEPLECEPVSC